jgi:hypothetical protein
MAKPDMNLEPKIALKSFIFQPILEFQKPFHYAIQMQMQLQLAKLSIFFQ